MKNTIALILAAGKGTRMKSKFPKVLKSAAFRWWNRCFRLLRRPERRQIVVVGFGGEQVRDYLGDRAETVVQQEQLGTGHAVLQAEPLLQGASGTLLVTCGDTPLVTTETFTALIDCHEKSGLAATVLTAHMPDPTGYGRVIRDDKGQVVKIVEQKDGTPEELAVDEVNAGIYCFDMPLLWDMLHNVTNDNAQGEYYLTDIIGMLVSSGRVVSARDSVLSETLGVNSVSKWQRQNKLCVAVNWTSSWPTAFLLLILIIPMSTRPLPSAAIRYFIRERFSKDRRSSAKTAPRPLCPHDQCTDGR